MKKKQESVKGTETEQKLGSTVEIEKRRLKIDNSNQVNMISNFTINVLQKVKIVKNKVKEREEKLKLHRMLLYLQMIGRN